MCSIWCTTSDKEYSSSLIIIWYQSSSNEEFYCTYLLSLFPHLLFLVIFSVLFQNLDCVSKSLRQCLMKTLVFIVLIVVTLLHAIYVVNTVILRLFVFAKWIFLLVMLKPQSFLLLEKFVFFVIILATLSTPIIKSMGSLLATNSPIGHPKPIIWLLLTLFLSFFS